MIRRLMLVVGIICAGTIPGLAAMSLTDCQSAWNKADKDGDSILTGAEAQPYAEAMAGTQQKMKDVTGQKIEQDEFLKACQAGAFDKMKVD